jgi:large subunit ribosomal protein L6
MSRVGRKPIAVPNGVDVKIDGGIVTVKGPRGELSMPVRGEMVVRQEDANLVVERPNDERHNRAMHGLTRSLLNNMIIGVTEGFTKELEIIGVGYRAVPKGPKQIELALGFSHAVIVDAPDDITIEVPAPTQIIVRGVDKELVGQVAANIRKIRKPEPYKGKGVRYKGEYVIRKAGKAAK